MVIHRHITILVPLPYSLQDEMFQKFNFDTEWAVKLISRLTDDDDVPIVGHSIMKQVWTSAAMFIISGIDIHV